MAAKAGKEESIRKTYRSHTHEEHIYEVPDTYIGSAEKDIVPVLVLSDDEKSIIQKEGEIVPGLYKVFDEVLVNALDHHTRIASMDKVPEHIVKQIKVTVDKSTGEISVWNDGMGIDVVEHPDKKIYVPEMIFGNLLTSTNYAKDEERVTGGKNGYGAKLANIFAKSFTVETVDSIRQKKYKQSWKDNMKVVDKPKIRSCKTKPFTCISWIPDYARFGLEGLSDDMMSLFHRRVLDCAAWCGTSIRVKWNNSIVPCRNILQYSKLVCNDAPVVQLKGTSRWEVLVSTTNRGDGFRQVSFVNGIHTSSGGRHVAHVTKQIVDAISELVKKRTKKAVRPSAIKECLLVIVKATIVNPAFKSQTKDELTTPVSKMGSRWTLDPKDVSSILSKTGLMDRLSEAHAIAEDKAASKTDGKKRNRINGIPKLEDATRAGTTDSSKCTLIVTEGDSAATTAISGLKVIGRSYYGIYPLKGKMINAKNASVSSLHDNSEVRDIKKILGLETGKKYTDVSSLRYGKIMVMTDQDHDGSHIKGLVMNMFHSQWPELLEMGFIVSMLTPIVKARRNKESISFYTLYDFETWSATEEVVNARPKWKIKYYKGLGTSTPAEARDYFRSLRGVIYMWDDTSSFEMDKAFMKGHEDARKTWISKYDPSDVLKFTGAKAGEFKPIQIADFVNKELIAYSHASNLRAIPSVVDGLKTSQRKILYGCFKKKLVSDELRVAQLAGYVSEHAAYHHGEESLNKTIIGMAQTFVGSNNINLLEPIGQFGSRLLGGKDASSPRYTHTRLSKVARALFLEDDEPVLKYLDDDGLPVEPEWYAPVIPLLLVNGSEGIGTGYSTSIPAHNPLEIIEAIKSRLSGDADPVSIGLPWWRGFTGTATFISKGTKVNITGQINKLDSNTLVITELPVGTWTKTYREALEKRVLGSPAAATSKKKPLLRDIIDEYNDIDVKITLEFIPGEMGKLEKSGKLLKELGLQSTVHLTNMWAYNPEGKLQKYKSADDILNDFYTARLDVYESRRVYRIDMLTKQHTMLSAKAAFIKAVRDGSLDLRTDDTTLLEVFESRTEEFPPLSEYSETSKDGLAGWKYLLEMSLRTLTDAKHAKLLEECGHIRDEITALKETTPENMWSTDLDVFEKVYLKFVKDREAADKAAALDTAETATNKRKTSRKTTRKKKTA